MGQKDLKPNANSVVTKKPLFIFWILVLFSLTKADLPGVMIRSLSTFWNNWKIAIGINSNNIQIFSDMPGFTTTGGTLPVNIIVSKLRPDIVIVNTKKKFVHLVELTVPFEHNISKAHERKNS